MLYTYNKAINTDRLIKEITSSAIVTALDYITTVGTTVNIYFKAALSAGDVTLLDSLITAHVNTPLALEPTKVVLDAPKTSTGIIKFSGYEPEGDGATIVTLNYADKCSWYMGAVQVTGGTLSTSDNIAFNYQSKTHWIDLTNGRLYDEDKVMLLSGNTYKPKIFIDSIEVTSGFTINYEAGVVTFDSTQAGVVTASLWYADKSWFRLRPKIGKRLAIKAAEVQFCQGITLQSPFIFAPWFVDHPIYGTMEIPGQQVKYKNFKDFISACNEGQGVIPAIGEITKDIQVFPFNYARPKPIKYSDFIEIRVYCKDHLPVNFLSGGQYATATFYVTIDDEDVV